MRTTVIAALLILSISKNLLAQEEKIYQDKMKPFTAWFGQWQGSGWMQMGPGEPKKFSVDETVQSKLDATIILIEGIGKGKDAQTNTEIVVHHALAILSYDPASDKYKFKSHIKNDRITEAWFTVSGDNKFQWGFDTPQGKIRYSITIDPAATTWLEAGEFSNDGNTWRKFFEMNLKKI